MSVFKLQPGNVLALLETIVLSEELKWEFKFNCVASWCAGHRVDTSLLDFRNNFFGLFFLS